FLTQWATPGLLYGLAVDPAGNVFVADPNGSQVEMYSKSGVLLTQWKVSSSPFNVAVGPDGMVYVAATLAHPIVKFAPAPTPTARETWGGVKARYRPGAATQDK